MTGTPDTGLKAPAFAALSLAFASLGDAFLYPFLPLNSDAAGVPVMWVGLLLSVNRLVRIFSNNVMVHVFARHGLRSVMVAAAVLAILSTLGYGWVTGMGMWLLLRIMWGVSFSAMRTGTIGYALRHEHKGFSLGMSRSIQEAGPMISLFLAPFLLRHFDPEVIFSLLGLLSMPALYFAFRLPEHGDRIQHPGATRLLQWPSTLNSITLISAAVIDGIIVVVLGVLFLQYRHEVTMVDATVLAAFYLGYRRACLVALSPAGGWIADRAGLDRVFIVSMFLVMLGLVAMVLGATATGAVIVFTFYSINAAITPGSASKGGGHALAAVTENATWRDIGAAAGTLAGGLLISSAYLTTVLLVAVFAMALLFAVHLAATREKFKHFLLWK